MYVCVREVRAFIFILVQLTVNRKPTKAFDSIRCWPECMLLYFTSFFFIQ